MGPRITLLPRRAQAATSEVPAPTSHPTWQEWSAPMSTGRITRVRVDGLMASFLNLSSRKDKVQRSPIRVRTMMRLLSRIGHSALPITTLGV